MNSAMIASLLHYIYWLIACVAEKWHFYFVKNYLYTDFGKEKIRQPPLAGDLKGQLHVSQEEIAFPFALLSIFAKLCSQLTKCLEGKSSRIGLPKHLTFVSILLDPKALNDTN